MCIRDRSSPPAPAPGAGDRLPSSGAAPATGKRNRPGQRARHAAGRRADRLAAQQDQQHAKAAADVADSAAAVASSLVASRPARLRADLIFID
eukprot:13672649-Alexandrium_andersonii.AAC.1